MTYREFIVPITGAQNDAIITKRALRLFDNVKVPTTLLFLEADPNTVLGWSSDGMVAGFSGALLDAVQESQKQLWLSVQDWAQDFPKFNLERAKGLGEGRLIERAIIADLIIISGECAKGESPLSPDFESTIMNGRIPALILNKAAEFNFKNCVIAWNGSAPAARALKAAVPFLRAAKKVTLFQIDNGAEDKTLIFDITKPQKYLENLGIRAHIEKRPKTEKSIGAEIINFAHDSGADLLVAGAYGHSRAREFIFGGTTRFLLKSQNGTNLLISH